MSQAIEIVPAIKSLKLHNVGCWQHLEMDFQTGVNIITDDGSALGKTSIFQAICLALVHSTDSLSPTFGEHQGNISIEFMNPSHIVEICPPGGAAIQRDSMLSTGEKMLGQLKNYIDIATTGTGLLIESDVAGILDDAKYATAADVLIKVRCQVIIQIGHNQFCEDDFPGARVFECYMDDSGKVGVRVSNKEYA